MNTQPFIIYRTMKYRNLLQQISDLLTGGQNTVLPETMPDSYSCAHQLIALADTFGFEGNLWHCFLALCIADDENAYSTSCEITGAIDGTLNELALHDFKILKELFNKDIRILDRDQSKIWTLLSSYSGANVTGRVFNKRIRDKLVELAVSLARAKDEKEFAGIVTEFYHRFGVGKYGLNKAFRIDEKGGEIKILPIINIEHISMKDLVGYELQKRKLAENTEAFIQGLAANNVLLYGDSGTGKSSSIKAILNEYYDRGLRIIEVYKHQFQCLSDILEQIKDRNYKFIIYMDDLSFEEFELEYKYLKAIIEGGLGKKPKNVLIYATSNRRHLIREKFSDKLESDDELHARDTVQEKLSLVARFGVTIYYGSPDKLEFQNIVKVLAERCHVPLPEEELLLLANQWELSHGGLSGRTASQFITHLLGMRNR